MIDNYILLCHNIVSTVTRPTSSGGRFWGRRTSNTNELAEIWDPGLIPLQALSKTSDHNWTHSVSVSKSPDTGEIHMRHDSVLLSLVRLLEKALPNAQVYLDLDTMCTQEHPHATIPPSLTSTSSHPDIVIGVNRPDLGRTCPALPADVPLSRSHSSMSRFWSVNVLL